MTAPQPNVVVVLTDQQRWDVRGVTPELERIARDGTRVEVAITPQPVCGPARASLQTGCYATVHGVFRNGLPLPSDLPTLAGSLAAAGYVTGHLGKWQLAGEDGEAGPVPPELRGGYQKWLSSDQLEATSDAYRTIVYDEDGQPVRLVGYRSDALFDAAVRFVADHHDRPFLLFISLLEPHHQSETDSYPAPDGYAECYQGSWLPPDLAALADPNDPAGSPHRHLAGYLGQLKRVDEGVARLRDALRSLELTDRTVLAWTSDHGSHFRTRNDEYMRSAHDASVRVPLVLTGPGFTGGGVVRQPVSTVDLMPTLLDAAGLPVPATVQGRSFLPLVGCGSDPDRPAEVFIQISESQVGRAVRTARWKYAVTAHDVHPWHDAGADRYAESELYDLDVDPYELDNLIRLESHREVADELRAALLRWMERVGEKPPLITDAPPRDPGLRRVDARARELPLAGVRFGHQ